MITCQDLMLLNEPIMVEDVAVCVCCMCVCYVCVCGSRGMGGVTFIASLQKVFNLSVK